MMVHDDEVRFRDLLQQSMRVEDGRLCGYKMADASGQALVAQMYAAQADRTRQERERQARASEESAAMGLATLPGGFSGAFSGFSPTALASRAPAAAGANGGGETQALRRDAQEARAERDLWLLLDILTRTQLLVDLDADQCDATLGKALAGLTERASVGDVVNAALLRCPFFPRR